MNLQPTHLQSDLIKLIPLQEKDFDQLFEVASDPLIWEQHPTRNRYQKEVFQSFFDGGIESKGAFLVINLATGAIIGSSRYYDLDPENKSVAIGYTFISRQYWGKNFNRSLKNLMINYAFESVDSVIFHIGENNIRSQKAIGKIGAEKIGEETMTYNGDLQSNLNFVYRITKHNWKSLHKS
ncbi:MAG: GNAT family N-acetyltransferase [Bacteroidota bacterium]